MKPVFIQRPQIMRKSSPTVVLLQMLIICVPLCAQHNPGQARLDNLKATASTQRRMISISW